MVYCDTQRGGRTGDQLGFLWNVNDWDNWGLAGIIMGRKGLGELRISGDYYGT